MFIVLLKTKCNNWQALTKTNDNLITFNSRMEAEGNASCTELGQKYGFEVIDIANK